MLRFYKTQNSGKKGNNIGRLLVVEFKENETHPFDEIMEVFRKYPDFQKYEVDYEPAISFPNLKILPDQRKVYCGKREVSLTTKEFNLLLFCCQRREGSYIRADLSKNMGQLCAGYREQHDWFPCMQIKRKAIQSLPESKI